MKRLAVVALLCCVVCLGIARHAETFGRNTGVQFPAEKSFMSGAVFEDVLILNRPATDYRVGVLSKSVPPRVDRMSVYVKRKIIRLIAADDTNRGFLRVEKVFNVLIENTGAFISYHICNNAFQYGWGFPVIPNLNHDRGRPRQRPHSVNPIAYVCTNRNENISPLYTGKTVGASLSSLSGDRHMMRLVSGGKKRLIANTDHFFSRPLKKLSYGTFIDSRIDFSS
jgi:hypothetical protein